MKELDCYVNDTPMYIAIIGYLTALILQMILLFGYGTKYPKLFGKKITKLCCFYIFRCKCFESKSKLKEKKRKARMKRYETFPDQISVQFLEASNSFKILLTGEYIICPNYNNNANSIRNGAVSNATKLGNYIAANNVNSGTSITVSFDASSIPYYIFNYDVTGVTETIVLYYDFREKVDNWAITVESMKYIKNIAQAFTNDQLDKRTNCSYSNGDVCDAKHNVGMYQECLNKLMNSKWYTTRSKTIIVENEIILIRESNFNGVELYDFIKRNPNYDSKITVQDILKLNHIDPEKQHKQSYVQYIVEQNIANNATNIEISTCVIIIRWNWIE